MSIQLGWWRGRARVEIILCHPTAPHETLDHYAHIDSHSDVPNCSEYSMHRQFKSEKTMTLSVDKNTENDWLLVQICTNIYVQANIVFSPKFIK